MSTELKEKALIIKNETTEGANTAERVGGWMVDSSNEILEINKISNITHIDGAISYTDGVSIVSGSTGAFFHGSVLLEIDPDTRESNVSSVGFLIVATSGQIGYAFKDVNGVVLSAWRYPIADGYVSGTRQTVEVPVNATEFVFSYYQNATAVSLNIPVFDYVLIRLKSTIAEGLVDIRTHLSEESITNMGTSKEATTPYPASYPNDVYSVKDAFISDKTKFLKSITTKRTNAGMARYIIGFVDQRNRLVIASEFDVVVTAGISKIDVLDKNIIVPPYYQVFGYIDRYNTGVLPYYHFYDSEEDNSIQTIVGTVTEELHGFTNTYGGYIQLSWELADYEGGIYSNKLEASIIEDTANEAKQIAIDTQNKNGVFHDANGVAYRAYVDENMNLKVRPILPSKVLVLGNSMTIMPLREYWNTHRAMAATKDGLGWWEQLQEALQAINSDAFVQAINPYGWESTMITDFTAIGNVTDDSTLWAGTLNELLDSQDWDLIINANGENYSGDITQFKAGYKAMMQYLKSKKPNAQLLISTMKFPSSAKDTAIIEVGTELNIPCLTMPVTSDSNYLFGLNNYFIDKDGVYVYNTHSGVAAHINEYGMLEMANIVLSYLNAPFLQEAHIITAGADITVQSYGVPNGLITVSCASMPTIKDSDNNTITAALRQAGKYTFDMPDSDVMISL